MFAWFLPVFRRFFVYFVYTNNIYLHFYIFRSHLQSMSSSMSLPLPLAGNETGLTGAQNASSSTFCLDLLLPAALNVTSWSQMNQVTKCSIYYKTFHDKIFYLFVLNWDSELRTVQHWRHRFLEWSCTSLPMMNTANDLLFIFLLLFVP